MDTANSKLVAHELRTFRTIRRVEAKGVPLATKPGVQKIDIANDERKSALHSSTAGLRLS